MNQEETRLSASQPVQYIKPWARGIHILAGIYNVVWGLLIYFYPQAYFAWLAKGLNLEHNSLVMWQGLAVVLLGILLLMAGFGTAKRWWISSIAMALKLIGGVLVYWLLLQVQVTKPFVFQLIMSDLIWLPLLFAALRQYKKAL